MKRFNSQICTTREQSKRLLALGLKKETADMSIGHTGLLYPYPHREEEDRVFIPAWSLHRLIEMTAETYVISKELPIYDALCEHIEWLIKEGYFNKEYLEEHQVVVNEYGKLCSEVEEHCKGVMEYLDYIREEE